MAHRVLLPILVLRNHAEYDPLQPGHNHSLDIAAIVKEVGGGGQGGGDGGMGDGGERGWFGYMFWARFFCFLVVLFVGFRNRSV